MSELVAAITAARLDFQALLGRPFTFADSAPMGRELAAPAAQDAQDAPPPAAPSDVPAAWQAAMSAPQQLQAPAVVPPVTAADIVDGNGPALFAHTQACDVCRGGQGLCAAFQAAVDDVSTLQAARAAQAAPVSNVAPVVPAGWRWMSARFPSRCGGCGGYIAAGDSILYRKGQRARHDRCPVVAPAAVVAPAVQAAPVPAPQAPQVTPAAQAAPKPARKPAARRKAASAPRTAAPARPLAPIAWDDNAF